MLTSPPTVSRADTRRIALKLLGYCRDHDWSGHDPYDALNSRIFTAMPFLNARLPRLVATQALKRSPVDLRRLMLIPPTQNPKALALFVGAALRLRSVDGADADALIDGLIDRLIALRSPGASAWCWGYSFPWQTRTRVVPRGTPNLVCTVFVAGALLDAYEQRGEQRCLDMAVSAAGYLLRDLYRTGAGGVAGFSYPLPSMPPHIHNANFLGAALFCRVSRLTGDARFRDAGLAAARWSAGRQQADGSWMYGDGATQGWIDNFHTGYNLCALDAIGRDLGTDEFRSAVARGFEFYRAHFFRADGAARYFHDRTFPIDIHCVAQSIVTLVTLRELHPGNTALAAAVLRWAVDHMWDERGFFYYRVLRLATIRTSYMRWSQAWMLFAISTLLAGAADASAWAPPRPSLAIA